MRKVKTEVEEIKISYLPTNINNPKVRTSKEAYSVLIEAFDKGTIGLQESFVVMYLNNQNQAKGIYRHSTGGITSTIMDIRLIMSVALKSTSIGMILCHNHPSGNLEPSKADKTITSKIGEACKLFDIKLLDHLIVSPHGTYFSFQDENLLD